MKGLIDECVRACGFLLSVIRKLLSLMRMRELHVGGSGHIVSRRGWKWHNVAVELQYLGGGGMVRTLIYHSWSVAHPVTSPGTAVLLLSGADDTSM